jgi:hypothetical protein
LDTIGGASDKAADAEKLRPSMTWLLSFLMAFINLPIDAFSTGSVFDRGSGGSFLLSSSCENRTGLVISAD